MNKEKHFFIQILLGIISLLFISPTAIGKSQAPSVIAVFNRINSNWQGVNIQAWLNDGFQQKIKTNDNSVFKYIVEKQSYVTFFTINHLGEMSIIIPNHNGLPAIPFKETSFPENMFLEPGEPVGPQVIYALSSEKPLPTQLLDIGLPVIDNWLFSVPSVRSEHVARQLSALIKNGHIGRIAIVKGKYQVVSSSTPLVSSRNRVLMSAYSSAPIAVAYNEASTKYSVDEIVDKFTKASRTIGRKRLPLPIKFESGSANLTESAKRDLDQFGKALERMPENMRFELGGHTDDVGGEEYNMDLSSKRAKSAKKYMISKYHISKSRIITVGHGEQYPQKNKNDLPVEEFREMNRRVEFILLRN